MEYMLTFHILNVYVDQTQPRQFKCASRAKKNSAHRHCRVDRDWHLSLRPTQAEENSLGALQRIFFHKSEFTMEVGGWVQVSLRFLLLLENHPKIALNQY